MMRVVKVLIKVGLGLTVLMVLAGVAVFALFDLDETLNGQKDKYLPELEKVLGRNVEVGAVSTTFFPVLGARLENVVVRGAKEGDDDLVAVSSIDFRVNLWRAIASAGTDVRLDSLIVDGLAVNLVREADGTLSYQDVVDRLLEGPPPDEKPKPLDPEAIKFIQSLKLSRIALERGRFRLVDKATGGAPAETYVRDLLVELDDVHLASPFEVHLAAAVFADEKNLDVRVRLGPIPFDAPPAQPAEGGTVADAGPGLPVDWVKVQATGIDLARITPYLGDAVPVTIGSAAFGAALEITDPQGAKGPIKISGDLSVNGLAVGAPTPGKPFDFKLSPNVEVDQKAGVVELRDFKLALDDMVLTATGRIEGLNEGLPSLKQVSVKTEKFHLGRLMAMLPAAQAALPPGAKLDGGFGIVAVASGTAEAQSFKVDLDFDQATIIVPGALSKPGGTPLNVHVDAHKTTTDLELKKLKLTVGDLVLALAGTVENFEDPNIDITGGTGRFDINGPVRLMPTVAKSIPPDVKIAGQSELDIKLKKSGNDIDASVLLGIYGADLAVPGTTVRGTGKIRVAARGNPDKNLSVELDAGLSGLDLQLADALHKAPGAPLDIKVSVTKAGDKINVGSLALTFGPLKIDGSGSANLKSGQLAVNANLKRFKISALAKMVPALAATPIVKAETGMKVGFRGDPNRLSTVNAELSDFYFGMGRNSLTGNMTVSNLEAPKIRFAFRSPRLDLDEMFPPSGDPDDPASRSEPPPIVRAIDAAGDLQIKRGRAGGFPFTQFVAALTMKNGVVRFSKLEFDAYDGHFSMAPTSADIGRAIPSFDANVAMRNVDAEKLLADQTTLGKTLSGRLTTQIAVKGRGAEWEQISKSLSGSLAMSMVKGRFHRADLRSEVISPLSRQIPMLQKPKGQAGTAVKNMAAQFSIQGGKMTLKKPMKVATSNGPLELDGHIGLDRSLKLAGTYEVPPKLIAAITKNRVRPKKAFPVSLKLGGTVTDPKISGIDVGEMSKMLTTELARSLGVEKLDEAKKRAQAMARAQVERARAAERRARARAKKEADKLRKRARDERKKAEKKAKKKAKDAAKKALKGLF